MFKKVTIGIPVFNGAATLRRAIESALHQTHSACIIRISDNASTDETAAIAQEFAVECDRVIYKRHSRTLPPGVNFESILRDTDTEYFMWLAADDYLEPSYVERTLEMLEADKSLVACVSRVRFVTPAGAARLSEDTYPLLADTTTNLAAFLSRATDASRFYALHRTESLRKSAPTRHFHGYDWSLISGTLLHGKYGEVPEVLMVREEIPDKSYARMVQADIQWRIGRIFPVTPLTIELIFRQRVPIRAKILKALLYQHVERHVLYMHHRYPSLQYANLKIWTFWRRYLAWRLITKAG